MQRRDLLKNAAGAGLGILPLGRHTWATVGNPSATRSQRLIVVFLRGAVDGLSVVAPYAEPEYYRARPTVALARPGEADGLLELDGQFGLHPSLRPLMPLWANGKLAFVHATGSHDVTRSHFDAQDYMESATPGRKSTPDGWLNRLTGVLSADPGKSAHPNGSVSVGPVLPRIFAGLNPVANIASGSAAAKPTLLDRPAIGSAFDQLYGGSDKLAQAYRASTESHKDVMASLAEQDISEEMMVANNGAALPNGFPEDAARLATLMRKDANVKLGFMAVGGWDTHANQGAAQGQLANRLAPLGQGLAALTNQLGTVLNDTVIVVMSEFGRTVRENGTRGTDHGHANVMWLLGGPVEGGRVHGKWPGLNQSALYEGRDLAVTTDFRQVLADVLRTHLHLSTTQLSLVLPNYTPDSADSMQFIRR